MDKEEAMKILKDFHDKSALFSVRTALETLHPELAESKDEKVRKAILELVRQSSEVLDKQNQNNMIAWLEKHYTKRNVDNAYVEGMVFAKNELKKQAESIFPELCESEDEKIRKDLITFLDDIWHCGKDANFDKWGKADCSDWISWLEKQGQEPRKVSIWKHWKDGICGNGEGKLIYLIKNGNDYSLSSILGFECDYIELSELDNLMLENQGEQKQKQYDIDVLEKHITKDSISELAHTVIVRNGWEIVDAKEQKHAWSEKDKTNGWTGVDLKRYIGCLQRLGTGNPEQPETINSKWFKEHCRPQPKQEWSDKEKQMYADIIEATKKSGVFKEAYKRELVDFLKSLKERYTWKPSDEQMHAFE